MDRQDCVVSEESLRQSLRKFWPAKDEQADNVVCWQSLLGAFEGFYQQSASASLAEEASLLDTFLSFSDGNSEDIRKKVSQFCNSARLKEVKFVALKYDKTHAKQAVNENYHIMRGNEMCPASLVGVLLKPGVTLMSKLEALKQEAPEGLSLGQALVQIAQDPTLNPFLNSAYKLLMAYSDDEFFPLESSQQMLKVIFQPFARLAFNQYQKKRGNLIAEELHTHFLKWYERHKDFFVAMWDLDRWVQGVNMQRSERQLVRNSFNKGLSWLLSHYADQSFEDINDEIEPSYPFPPLTRQQFHFNCHVARELNFIITSLHPFFKQINFDKSSADQFSSAALLKLIIQQRREIFEPAIEKLIELESCISGHVCKSSLFDESLVSEIRQHLENSISVQDANSIVEPNFTSFCERISKVTKKLSCFAESGKSKNKDKQADLLELNNDISSLLTRLRMYRNNASKLDEGIAQSVKKIIDDWQIALEKANDLLFLGYYTSCSAMLSVVKKFNEQLKEFFAKVSENPVEAIKNFVSESKKIIAQARQNEALIVHRNLFMEGIRQCCRLFSFEGPSTDRIARVVQLVRSIIDLEHFINSKASDANDENFVTEGVVPSKGCGG